MVLALSHFSYANAVLVANTQEKLDKTAQDMLSAGAASSWNVPAVPFFPCE